LEDLRNVGESSCNSGDGTDQRVQSLMFMMMMMMMSVPDIITFHCDKMLFLLKRSWAENSFCPPPLTRISYTVALCYILLLTVLFIYGYIHAQY
jgi:hypothetical protein